MWNARHALIASRCSWCSQVWTGKDWILERRPPGVETYSHGICAACAALHFAGGRDQTHLAVERFQMVPHQRAEALPSPLAGGKLLVAKALYVIAKD